MKTKLECPHCEGQAHLKKNSRSMTYQSQEFTVMKPFYRCTKCKQEFSTKETTAAVLKQLQALYAAQVTH